MKQLTLLIIGLVLISTIPVLAQTKTATSSPSIVPTISIEEKQIENFKEKIATKVAELRKKDQKAVAGFVTDDKNLQIKTDEDDTYTVKIDDTLTKLYQITLTGKKEIKADDLAKGDYIIISGPILDKTINANVVYRDEDFITKDGKVTEVNKDDDSLKVVSSEKDSYTLDVDTKLKIQIMDSKTLDLGTGTLSKVKEGDTIHFVFKKTGKEKEANRYQAYKILIIPQEFFQIQKPSTSPTP